MGVIGTEIFGYLERRRSELGLTYAALARRSGVGMRTVQRLLAGEADDATLRTVGAIAGALGVTHFRPEATPVSELRRQTAERKADRLTAMVQATSALEAQAVDEEVRRQIHDRIVAELLAGPRRRLWDE
jgi:transcriptional regulator with XRE-family HTH domain